MERALPLSRLVSTRTPVLAVGTQAVAVGVAAVTARAWSTRRPPLPHLREFLFLFMSPRLTTNATVDRR